MKDIFPPIEAGKDARVISSDTAKAANILSVQLGSLTYQPNFGVDLDYFLSESTRFQNSSFQAYLVEAMANQGVNVTNVLEIFEPLYRKYVFDVNSENATTELIAR